MKNIEKFQYFSIIIDVKVIKYFNNDCKWFKNHY